MADLHKFPFPVIAGVKHGRSPCEVLRVGGVSDEMDKDIGRPVIRIKGSVSANNYIEFDGISLVGRYFYFQMKLLKPHIATLHLELLLQSKSKAQPLRLRITISTLYQKAKCVGTILRLPFP